MPNPNSTVTPRTPSIPATSTNRDIKDSNSSKYHRMTTDRGATQIGNSQGRRSRFSFWMRKIMQPSRDIPPVISTRTRAHGNAHGHGHDRGENGRNHFGQQRHTNDDSTPGNNSTGYIISNTTSNHTLKSKGDGAPVIKTSGDLANIPTKSSSGTTATILPVREGAELVCKVEPGTHTAIQTDMTLLQPLSSGSETDLSLSNMVADVYYYSDSATINSSMIPNYNAVLSDDGEEDSFSIDNSNMNNNYNNSGNNRYTTSIYGNSITSNSSPYPNGNTADRISREERDMRRSSIARRSTYNTNRTDRDDASLVPLFSICSSSVKSSIFSDINSLQSTKPTVHTVRTVETNSSIIAIPPASILDRANTTATTASTTQNVPTSPYYVHSSSVGPSLHRWNSSVTVDSVVTLKS